MGLTTDNNVAQLGFPSGSDGKQSACNVGGPGLIPGSGRSPGEGNGNSLQYSCLENPMNGRSLVSPNPWGHKKSDMSEQLTHTLSYLPYAFLSPLHHTPTLLQTLTDIRSMSWPCAGSTLGEGRKRGSTQHGSEPQIRTARLRTQGCL